MSGADRYQEAGQALARWHRDNDPDALAEAHVQALLAVAAATVLPLVVQHMGDTDAITDWARGIAPDILRSRQPRFESATDGDPRFGLWLAADGSVVRWRDDQDPDLGWRRLYVQVPGGEV